MTYFVNRPMLSDEGRYPNSWLLCFGLCLCFFAAPTQNWCSTHTTEHRNHNMDLFAKRPLPYVRLCSNRAGWHARTHAARRFFFFKLHVQVTLAFSIVSTRSDLWAFFFRCLRGACVAFASVRTCYWTAFCACGGAEGCIGLEDKEAELSIRIFDLMCFDFSTPFF